MSNEFCAKGTIKVKNQDGVSVPFMPRTTTANVIDDSGSTLTNVISTLGERTSAAAQKGGIKVMYEEPTTQNTSTFGAKTMIGYVLDDNYWSFTVDTTKEAQDNATTGIPFTIYQSGNNAPTLTVDWGDGTTQTLRRNDYLVGGTSSQNNSASLHTYSEPGTYTIKIWSSNWENTIYLTAFEAATTKTSVYTNCVYYFRNTLISVDKPFPLLYENVRCHHNLNDSAYLQYSLGYYMFYGCLHLASIPSKLFMNFTSTNFTYAFYGCTSLTSIPRDLFKYNTATTNFDSCFYRCTSLTSIPENLFKYNTAAERFDHLFGICTSLTSIPENLFKYNTAVQYFSNTFSNCTSLTSIPGNLFKYNIRATTFEECFRGCTSLIRISGNLFKYNTAVQRFNGCFYDCGALNDFAIHIGATLLDHFEPTNTNGARGFVSPKSGTTRIVYVPAGSQTCAAFRADASSTLLTIIEE